MRRPPSGSEDSDQPDTISSHNRSEVFASFPLPLHFGSLMCSCPETRCASARCPHLGADGVNFVLSEGRLAGVGDERTVDSAGSLSNPTTLAEL